MPGCRRPTTPRYCRTTKLSAGHYVPQGWLSLATSGALPHSHCRSVAGALTTLSKLDKPVRRRLEAATDQLAEDPRPVGVVTIKSIPGHLRLRVGDYRPVYAVQDHGLVVLFVELGHRREIYR